jgi:hypothetical protein
MSGVRFSRRTVIAAVDLIATSLTTHAALTHYFLTLGSDLASRCDAGGLRDRFNHLIKFYDEDHARDIDGGALLQDVLIEKAVSLLPPIDAPPFATEPPILPPPVESFLRALERDGFVVRDGNLLRALPEAIQLPAALDEVSRLLKERNLVVPQGHLDQALDAHSRGDWAAANSQIRIFLESLFDEIAAQLDPIAVAGIASGQPRRQHLANMVPPFLDRALNEWRDNGGGFLNGLVTRLHPQGSHPGLSDEDDSTFRLHMVLLTARLMLVRFDRRMP